jgi:dGTP triphosphohydrolase
MHRSGARANTFSTTSARRQALVLFCHNAQRVRAMTELENDRRALNLTHQVLDGMLAHNGVMLHPEYVPHYGMVHFLIAEVLHFPAAGNTPFQNRIKKTKGDAFSFARSVVLRY